MVDTNTVQVMSQSQIEDLVADVLQGKGDVAQQIGFNSSEVEGLYGVAYSLLTAGKPEDALAVFSLLAMLQPLDARFVMGTGLCLQHIEQYELGYTCFFAASQIDESDPKPLMLAAECLLAMHNRADAASVLQQVIARAAAAPQYQALKSRAEVVLENLTT